MATFGKTIRTGVAAALMLAAITTNAQGLVPGGVGAGSFGGESRGAVQTKGTVVCASCSLDEIRKAQPRESKLYQLTHRRGQMVMKVSEVNDSRWSYFTWPPRLWVISPAGEHLGTIIAPKHIHNLAWGDEDGKTLYLCARSGLYRMRLNIPGNRSAKS
jgi:hypothetical protein